MSVGVESRAASQADRRVSAVPLESCPGFLDTASEAQPLSLWWTLTTVELIQRCLGRRTPCCLVQRAGASQRVVSPGALPSPSPPRARLLLRGRRGAWARIVF